jgi:hypothetical protein
MRARTTRFAVRESPLVERHFNVHRIPARVRDDRDPPFDQVKGRELGRASFQTDVFSYWGKTH